MPDFALTKDGQTVAQIARFEARPPDPAGKDWYWLPVVHEGVTVDEEVGQVVDLPNDRAIVRSRVLTLDEEKDAAVSEVKAAAFARLQPTDWRVIRQAEGGDTLDEATARYRAAVRQASNDAETAIENAKTSATVREIVTAVEWPQPSESEE